ncbi:MAG: sigma-54 dependent transcriptional regulator [Verrucomicrobiota bacterium]|nr:sigma-54 dependent transcriptional regulator [Verrucomicrobiota bacterium]
MADASVQKNRQLHPIIEKYCTSDIPLEGILADMPSPLKPVPAALLSLLECLQGKRLAREAIRSAQKVPLKEADTEVLILMLSAWAELACRIGRPSDAESLLHRIKDMVSDSTPPEILAQTVLVESVVAETIGNLARREELIRNALELLPAYSPRRKFCLWELTFLLAQQGRASDAPSELKDISWQSDERFSLNRAVVVRFVNHVETGQIQEAARLLVQLTPEQKEIRRFAGPAFRTGVALLRLMQGGVDANLLPGSRPSPDVPNSVRIAYSLILRDTNEALRLARLEASKLRGSIFGAGFASFGLIRAELAAGNADSALRLLKIRQARGNRQYMDDFFFARANLLLDSRANAARHFAGVLNSVERYDARGRLDFELKLACEMSQGDVLRLSQSAERLIRQFKEAGVVRAPIGMGADTSAPLPPEAAGLTPHGANMILGGSTAVSEIREAIIRYANLDAPVLITGETGTGKDLVARALHDAGRRRARAFIPVNCGSLTETLLESELFGHERGAFTGAERATKGLFEETGQGTILLDEISDISLRLQATLLRVLETGEIRAVGSAKTRRTDCRIVAATNVELEKLADDGKFRKDLLFRLQRLLINIPPLRERRNDILLLARHFLDLGRRIGIHATMSKELREALRSYDWPGNVRELKNVIERMRLMHSDKLWYDLSDMDLRFQETAAATARLKLERKPAAAAEPAAPNSAEVFLLSRSRIRQGDRLRELFQKHKKLTRSEVIEILNISPNTATKYLRDLCNEGFIERVEPSASTRSYYFALKAAPTIETSPPADHGPATDRAPESASQGTT